MEKVLRGNVEALIEEKGSWVGNYPSREFGVYSIRDPPVAIVRTWIDQYGRLDMSYHSYTAIGREEDIEALEKLL